MVLGPSALVVVATGGQPDLVMEDLVDKAMLVGDARGPIALKSMFQWLGLADPSVGTRRKFVPEW
jgi:hypothetical protein